MDLSHPATAVGIGLALGASPGPVQVLLLSESARGGLGRGFRLMAVVNGTFLALLLVLAVGFSAAQPGAVAVRLLRVAGGAFLVVIGLQDLREARRSPDGGQPPPTRTGPLARGSLAVILNPPLWIFLATTASAVLVGAARAGGRPLALITCLAMVAGVALADVAAVLVGSGGGRLPEGARRTLDVVLALALAAIGAWFLVQGALGST